MRIARAGAHFGYSGWKLRNRMNAFTDSGILFAPDRVEESRASGRPAFARILQLERLILYLLALPKSLYFNLRMFGRRGLRLPVLVSHRVALYSMEGRVELPENAPFGMVKIGFGAVGLFDRARSRSILDNRGAMIFRGPAFIGHGTKMATGPAGEIEFGSHFQISAEAQLYAAKRITFGRNCGVSWDVLILDDDFHPVYNRAGKRLNLPKEVRLSDDVWVGCRATILKGTFVARGCLIAAGSVVHRRVREENCVIGGNPAAIQHRNVFWRE